MKKDFGAQVSGMCFENPTMTRKMAKIFVKAINQPGVEKQSLYLKALKKFILINDSLKQQRLEWVFGVAQLVHNKQGGAAYTYSFGIETVDRLNDEAYTYVTNLLTTSSSRSEDALLSTLLKGRGRLDTFCCKALKDLLSLCVKDT
jgi:hypothetical protein